MRSLLGALCLLCSLFAQATATLGQPAPFFDLTDQHGQRRTNEQFIGKWLVLYFYPKADTPSCTEEAQSFRDNEATLRTLNAEVVGVSTDPTDSILAFGNKHQLHFALLSDPDGVISARYDALLDLGIMKFAKRHTFLIDPQGKLVKRYTDLDTKNYAHTIIKDLRKMSGKQ